MAKSIRILLCIFLISAILLTACGATSADAPAKTVEAYWQSMAAQNANQMSSLTCSDYQATALNNLASFQSVKLVLKDLKCTTTSSTDTAADVTCKGTLVATYGTENSEIDLSANTYSVVKQGGDWLMCGER
jgi:ABC-type glycerol-3-phosphate transport system substrate-binding protein